MCRSLALVVTLALIVSPSIAADRVVSRHSDDSAETAMPMPFPRRVPVEVVNLPLDGQGNLKVMEQSTQPKQVEVVNFPSPQPGPSAVSVNNLPVDSAGNVRVSIHESNDAAEVIELLAGPLVVDALGAWTVPIDLRGARYVGLWFNIEVAVPHAQLGYCYVNAHFQWRWLPAQPFFTTVTADPRYGNGVSTASTIMVTSNAFFLNGPLFAVSQGPEARVAIDHDCVGSVTVSSILLYVVR